MLTCSQAHRGRELCSAIGSCQLGRPAVPHRVWGALCSFPPPPGCTQSPAPIAAFIDSFCTNKAR